MRFPGTRLASLCHIEFPPKPETAMPDTKPVTKPRWQRALISLSGAVIAALVLAALYWMRSVFVPIALAVFFASVLAPVVTFSSGGV